MTGQDLMNELDKKRKDMNKCILALGRLGREAAQSERVYRVGLAKEMLVLKDAGYSVTLIPDLARGNEVVASLKQARDIAESLQKANVECINALKVEIRILEETIKREWGAAE